MRPLIDLRTGAPVIDYKGDMEDITIQRAFNQFVDVMLHTPIGEEQSNLGWGVPIREIFEIPFNSGWEMMVKYYFTQALDQEPLVDKINDIKVERDGSTVEVTLNLTSIWGNKEKTEVFLNV